MDGDEQEDLLVNVSDSDDSPEESDAYLDLSRKVIQGPPFRHGLGRQCCFKKRAEFVGTGVLCLVSATALLVLLPLYLETSTRVADIYPSILFCSATSVVLSFSCICIRAKFRIFSFSSFKKNVIPPISLLSVLQLGYCQGLGGLCIVYALDRQRVLCHLQDPMKGIILVFSMIYYFCFSKKIMGLQKVFCATTIVIGLFVSVDYALCDEFHCRGYEREKVEDDGGQWNRTTHFLWGLTYIAGLGLWCFHFSVLEGQIVSMHLENQLACKSRNSLLETISCMVSSQNGNIPPEGQWDPSEPSLIGNEYGAGENSSGNRRNEDQHMPGGLARQNGHINSTPSPSALSILFSVNLVSFFFIFISFWTSMLHFVGKSSSWSELLNNSHIAILCHFQPDAANNSSLTSPACGSLAQYGWMFAASFLIFSFSAYHFLIMCQSSVFTVALITSALPLANIFWSVFKLAPNNGGYIEWWPNFTPELVCTLLGIPIIVTGLVLMCKAHWTNTTQKELCCTLRYHPRPALT
ncbi:uncharacterized protein LOC117643942 [Thrips palmi]|uniref:Uncharacterized protein LOC117643942 n=1 Tax=Thrips palmi TaxID=161013 RepID=A0A6P8YGZ4_THRPL|nr:uncharacterized protein LOC117643942 [Thrips palmi]